MTPVLGINALVSHFKCNDVFLDFLIVYSNDSSSKILVLYTLALKLANWNVTVIVVITVKTNQKLISITDVGNEIYKH